MFVINLQLQLSRAGCPLRRIVNRVAYCPLDPYDPLGPLGRTRNPLQPSNSMAWSAGLGGEWPLGAQGALRARESVVNKYLQSWEYHNLFTVGANVFPHNASYNPTGPVGALAYWTAEAIKR
jgi:hypothetical protein